MGEEAVQPAATVGRKRARVGGDGEDMKRVAEIVLVLSVMGAMRGGRRPTEVERELMAEARGKLALICEGIAPKDIVPRDAVRAVIDDLGLDRSGDQRLGFRPRKMSISEKLQLTKRKMEESKKFTTQSAIYSPQMLSSGLGAKAESHGGYAPLTLNEPQSAIVSKGPFNSHGDRDSSSFSLPRTEATHFRLDGASNALPYSSQGKGTSPFSSEMDEALLAKGKVGGSTTILFILYACIPVPWEPL
ncbi:hypothetical protein Syun_016630 [Stephania yunnanensis]|uniref:DUF7797 domain-containing protein n=1 Tax=Stephania yunnanensis TaxID=152371 RepID=A0AAP0J7P6_9MAGN